MQRFLVTGVSSVDKDSIILFVLMFHVLCLRTLADDLCCAAVAGLRQPAPCHWMRLRRMIRTAYVWRCA